MQPVSWLTGKDSDAGRDWGQEEKGMTEDEMAGWHHRLDGHESEWTLGVGDGQGGLACCDSWGWTRLSNWTELNWRSRNTEMGGPSSIEQALNLPLLWANEDPPPPPHPHQLKNLWGATDNLPQDNFFQENCPQVFVLYCLKAAFSVDFPR